MKRALLNAAVNACRLLSEWLERRADQHERHPVDLIRDAWITNRTEGEEARMKIVKGSDLVGVFGAIHELQDWAKFISIRSATSYILARDVITTEDSRELLEMWMRLTAPRESPEPADAVDPHVASTGTLTTRDNSSS